MLIVTNQEDVNTLIHINLMHICLLSVISQQEIRVKTDKMKIRVVYLHRQDMEKQRSVCVYMCLGECGVKGQRSIMMYKDPILTQHD